ncbi:MAG: nitroreductase/quinone reductase family protein [Myxococcota bacterium]
MPVRWLSAATLLAALGCNGPFGLLPGGRLDGDTRPTPERWDLASDTGTMQLETAPEEPYSVNVNYTLIKGALYVNAGDTETQWAKNIAANPEVRVRIKGTLYSARANRVTDPDEVERFALAWTSLNGFWARDPRKLDEVWIYHVVPR